MPYVDFDMQQAVANLREINPDITVLRVSARTGEGLDVWYAWLREEAVATREATFI